jgi:hypothetical protein
MKRTGGRFDYCYNAQTAVDDAAHIIVAAELTSSGADSRQLPRMAGDDPRQVSLRSGI